MCVHLTVCVHVTCDYVCVSLNVNCMNICYACCVCVKANRLTSPRAGRHSRTSSDTCSFSGRLLTISPAEELTFIADETGKEIFDIIILTNTLMYPIAFKVRLCCKVVSRCVLSCVSLVQFSSVMLYSSFKGCFHQNVCAPQVKTTAPEKYRVRPSTGVVKPGETFEVYVYLQPGMYKTPIDNLQK